MKQLLLVSLAIRFGGGETYLEQLVPFLKDRVRLFAVCIHPEVNKRFRALGIRTFYLDLSGKGKGTFRIPVGLLLLVYLRLFHQVSSVLLNGYAPAALALPARLLGYRTYLIAHLNLTPRKTLKQKLFLHRRYLTSVWFANRVICVSNPVGTELQAIFPKKNVCVIPNWVAAIPPSRDRSRMSDSLLSLLFVGRLVELKGLAVLLGACRKVSGVRLVVVGEGAWRTRFEEIARGLDVSFVGFQQATAQYFQDADIFINPSFGPEGLPMVSLEAMSNGLPCILSDLPVHVDISESGRATMLFKAGDVDDLARCISKLVADFNLRREYGERAKQAVMTHYSAPGAAIRYLRALEVE